MESQRFNVIEAKQADPNSENKPNTPEIINGQTFGTEHAEAVALVEKHRDFFEHYARGKVKIEPAPSGLDTFAFDLEKNIIYVNSMFYKKRGFSEEKTVFGICHEIEHFLEKIQVLSEEGGGKKFEKYLKRIKISKAFSLMDNCVADIRENRTVVNRTNEGMADLEVKIYKEDFFVESDFTAKPRHIQFCNAILRENRLTAEKCTVDPEVRLALDEVSKVPKLLDIMTNPETSMSVRLKLQEKYIWPKVKELLEKDIEDKKKQKEQAKKNSKKDQEKGEGQGENNEEEENDGKENKEENKEKGGKTGGEIKEETDPNKIFADEYEEEEKRFPNAVPMEEIEKAFKQWKEGQKNNSAEKVDEDYAEKIGVSKEDLKNYRKIVEELGKIVNPETDVSVLEELRKLFSRIILKRLKIMQAPKYPVEEGDELVDPAQLVADVKSGNLQPKVWEDTEIKEKKGDMYGEVEITLVCDRSGSMTEGQKAEEQRKSAVLVMEVLKEFAELCEEEKINVSKPLEIRSEIYSFKGDEDDGVPLKKMSSELGEVERIDVLKKLFDLHGSTADFNCLEAINRSLDENIKRKIQEGKLKKIVIVFTDGGSDNPTKVQSVLSSLRGGGVVVIGVGLTEDGEPVVSTYAPNALVVKDVKQLPFILGELLKEHLKDI